MSKKAIFQQKDLPQSSWARRDGSKIENLMGDSVGNGNHGVTAEEDGTLLLLEKATICA